MWYDNGMKFEWDPQKESININKHGISFQQAREALTCGMVVVLKEDDDYDEGRFVFLGMCGKLNILVVVAAYPGETVTRIISARKATKKERLFYETEL